MKLLLFSDVHVSKRYCQRLVEMAEEADLVVGAGDFGAMRRGIQKTIDWLKDIRKPAVLVPGNAESYEELQEAAANWPTSVVLHGNGTELMGISFFGIGGGIPITPFGSWSYDFTEEQAVHLLKDCPENAVLVSHSPPKGMLDVSSSGQHFGSEEVRNVIEVKTPQLVVCGHIHESGGNKTELGDTDIVNAGPKGMYYDIDIP